MKSIVKNIRISPKKLNLVAEMVRRKPVKEADAILQFMAKRGGIILKKALASAVSNAENNFKQDANSLIVEEIIVGKGPSLKRFMPVSRGRAHPILKRTSQVMIRVGMGLVKAVPATAKASLTEKPTEKTKKAETITAKAPKTSAPEKSASVKKVRVTKKTS